MLGKKEIMLLQNWGLYQVFIDASNREMLVKVAKDQYQRLIFISNQSSDSPKQEDLCNLLVFSVLINSKFINTISKSDPWINTKNHDQQGDCFKLAYLVALMIVSLDWVFIKSTSARGSR
jgi:hypothetical protein